MKAATWVVALLNWDPHYVACNTILLIWINPRKGVQKKRHFECNFSQFEAVNEAVTST